MALTKTQELLLDGLKIFKVQKDSIVAVMLALKTESQMMKLMEIMARNPRMTEEEILLKTVQISKNCQ